MFTQLDVEKLGRFRPGHCLATTLYLPLDAGRPARFPVLARDLIRQAERSLDEALGRGRPAHDVLLSAREDLARLGRHLDGLNRRQHAPGLAAFSCAAEDYWQAINVPVPPPARLLQEATFYVRPLAGLLDEYRPILLALVDRRRARLFNLRLAQVTERSVPPDDVPGKVREGGWQGYAESSIRGHIEEHVHRHFERVAARMLDIFREDGFEWLVVGGPEPTLPDFIDTLHPYLRERLRATLTLETWAPDAEVAEVGRQVERRIKAERDAELLRQVKEGLFPGGWAVSGPSDTLQLVPGGQVRTLLMRPGFSRQGVWCPRCRLLLPDVSQCPQGCRDSVESRDVIDEAVWIAFEEGAEVAHVESPEMEELGNIAALLRYG